MSVEDQKRTEKELERALALIARLVEPYDDDCQLDHHGYCQAHALHSAPCPYAVAKQLLTDSRRTGGVVQPTTLDLGCDWRPVGDLVIALPDDWSDEKKRAFLETAEIGIRRGAS